MGHRSASASSRCPRRLKRRPRSPASTGKRSWGGHCTSTRRVPGPAAAARSAAPAGLGEDQGDGGAARPPHGSVHAERRALTALATPSEVFVTKSGTAGEVVFAGDEPTDKPGVEAHAAPKSGLCPPSSTISKPTMTPDMVARVAATGPFHDPLFVDCIRVSPSVHGVVCPTAEISPKLRDSIASLARDEDLLERRSPLRENVLLTRRRIEAR